ncbi:MAG: response regulator [Polyangiales bacterium]
MNMLASTPTQATPPAPHVVIVDDETDLCELIALRLEHHGYRVSSEHGGRGALDLLEREPVDLMLLDLRLGGEDGLDVLADVRRHSTDLPVIILTAHGTIEVAVEATKRGAFGFLTKPFDDRELVSKIALGVQQRQRPEGGSAPLARRPGAALTAVYSRVTEQLVEQQAPLPPLRDAREAFDRAYLEELLRRVGGNVSAAARMAGRNRTDFYELLHRYALNPVDFRA